jgi:xanthine/CO dehydrogenase XdhC/CoxF family maturation factor
MLNLYERQQLHNFVTQCQVDGRFFMICTLTAKQGPFLRDVGYVIAMDEAGTSSDDGLPPCLKARLRSVLQEIKENNDSPIVSFQMDDDDDLLFGTASGCGGEIQMAIFGREYLDCEQAGSRLLPPIRSDGGVILCRSEGAGEPLFSWSNETSPQSQVSLGSLPSDPVLIAMGRGADCEVFCQMAEQLGWLVLHGGRTNNIAWSSLKKNQEQYKIAVALSHDYLEDVLFVEKLSGLDIRHCLITGPKSRCEGIIKAANLVKPLAEDWLKPNPGRFKARSAIEIAVAITGEIQELRQGALNKRSDLTCVSPDVHYPSQQLF